MITSPWLPDFLMRAGLLPGPGRVLELGTRRWGQTPTTRKSAVEAAGMAHVGTDASPGEDVDAVADAHELGKAFPEAAFAGCLCENVLEHCRRPWLVAEQLALVLRPGGVLLVTVPQAFPVHGYPGDYWRMTADAVEELFRDWFEVEKKGHLLTAKVVPTHNDAVKNGAWNFEAPAWLMSHALLRRKPS